MTTLEQALLNTELTPFEGKSVRQVGLEAPSASGGLRESMRIDPVELQQGDRVVTIMEHVVAKVRFEPIDKDDPGGDQRRVHVLTTETAAIATGELVSMVQTQLAAQADRIKAARAAAKGYDRLPYDDDNPEPEGERPEGMTDEEWEASGDGTGETLPPIEPAEGTTSISGRKPRQARKRAGG